MADRNNKYDRQLRIWGDQGQTALENASVCLLNCGPTGSETLKNLVLGGIGSITVVDGSKVEEADLGNNFMVDLQSLGQSKAKSVCSFLQELNDSVKAKFVEESPDALISTNPAFFSQFTLVVATQLMEPSVIKLDKICRDAHVGLIIARSYGLTGLVRISFKEHDIIETKPDHFLDDLRLNNPWPELKKFADNIDLNTEDPVEHKHVPYVVILVKLAEEWTAKNGSLPSSRQEMNKFKDMIKSKMLSIDEDNYKEAVEASFRVSAARGIREDVLRILDDCCSEVDSTSSDFWVLVAALKEFIMHEGGGEPPLEGSIPDMTSSTECYVSLQKIYLAKAEADIISIERRVAEILRKTGREPGTISKAYIKNFCRNARKIAICRYRSVEEEFNSPATEIQRYLTDEDYSGAAGFYVLLRAVDKFYLHHNRFPGFFDGRTHLPRTCEVMNDDPSLLYTREVGEDVARLRAIVTGIANDLGINASLLSDDLVSEMCRFGGAELHVVASFIGGVASEQAIKLITKQFIPMKHTFVFNGIDKKSQLLAL